MDILDKQKFIFGSLFLLANKLQTMGDQLLGNDGMTVRQWFLTVMIIQFQDHCPTLGEVANLMGSSHQNVKQLALKLQKKDFLTIEQDTQDRRAIRLKLTEKSHRYWKTREAEGDDFIRELFRDLTEEEINLLSNSFNKLFGRIEQWKK
ncbi:MAG: MarR family transcriptional regulator [Clostridiaceae bacterium]|nr:MarR family transcriptional regulator [Clostridiaceae bacterium]